MTSINGIAQNPGLDKERLEINANIAPAYLVNDQQPISQQELSGASADFAGARQRAVSFLKNHQTIPLNYIANTPEPHRPFPLPNPQHSELHGSAGEVGGRSGVGAGENVEEKAVEAAQELLTEADNLEDELGGKDWIITDPSGYEYVDPEFFAEYSKLISILNALQILGIVIDAIRGLKKMILDMLTPDARGGGGGTSETSASEVLGVAREVGFLKAQGQLLEMTEKVSTDNKALLDGRLKQFKEDSSDGPWYEKAYDWISEITTSGGSDALSRHEDARYAEAAYEEMQRYETFQKEVQAKYDAVLGDSALYRDGITNIGDIFKNLGLGNMSLDIGGGKIDIDRNKLSAYEIQLTKMENYRRLLFMLRAAIQELKSLMIEGTTGKRSSYGLKQMLQGVIENLDNFENMVFSNISYQLQSTIAAQNTRVDAKNSMDLARELYGSAFNPLGGSTPLLGGLTRNITDYFALLSYDNSHDLDVSPSQLDLNQVNQILINLYGTSLDGIKKDISQSNNYVTRLDGLQRREWEIIAELNEDNLVYTKDDETQGLYESKINALREELVGLQNTERLIILLSEAINRLKRIILKMQTGIGDIKGGEEIDSTLKAGFESRLATFDLKSVGLKNKVEEFNKELKEKKQLSQAGWTALGSFLGVGVAAGLIVVGAFLSIFSGGVSLLGVIALIGFVSALGQLGASLSKIIWDAVHPVDDRKIDNDDFYRKAKDKIEDDYNRQIDQIDYNSHIDAESSSDGLSAGNQWAEDTRLLMSVRDQLTKTYIYEQILILLVKAQQDVKNTVVAAMTGVNAGDDFTIARDSTKARFEQKIKAFGYKKDLIEDYISRRNMHVSQDTELNWAILNACISVVSIVTMGATLGIGNSLGTVVQEALQWVSFVEELGASAAQAAKQILEGDSGYDELGNYRAIEEMIGLLVEGLLKEDPISAGILRNALAGVSEKGMQEQISAGRYVVDPAQYYAGMRAIQHLFNRIIGMLRVAEGIAKVKARISGATAPVGASDAFEAEKADLLAQLDLLNSRVRTYVERSNAMAEAWRQLTVTLVLAAVKIIMKALQKTGTIEKIKTGIKNILNKAGIGEKQLVTNVRLANNIAKFITGNANATWDGTVGASAIASLLFDLLSNQQMMALITRKIYDAAKGDGDRSNKVQKVGTLSRAVSDGSASTVANRLDALENGTYNSQLDLSGIEADTAALDVASQLQAEMNEFVIGQLDTVVNSGLDHSWLVNPDVLHAVEELEQNNPEAAKLERGYLEGLARSVPMEKVKWSDPAEVKKFFSNVQNYIQTAKIPADQARMLVAAEAQAAAEIIARSADKAAVVTAFKDGLVKPALANLPAADQEFTSFALAVIASRPLGDSEADNFISDVWGRAAKREISGQTAGQVTQYAALVKPETVAINQLTAEFLNGEPKLRDEINLILKNVDWSDPKQVEAKLNQIQQLVKEKADSDPASLDKPDSQAMLAATAFLAASIIAANPSETMRNRAPESLRALVDKPASSEGLKAYAQMILDQVELNKTAVAAAKGQPASKVNQLVLRLCARVKAMERSVEREADPADQLNAMKTDIGILTRSLDTKKLGLDLASIKSQLEACSSPEEMAAFLQSTFLNNPAFVKTLSKPAAGLLIVAVADLNALQVKIKIKGATDMIITNPAEAPQLMADLRTKSPGLYEQAARRLEKKGVIIREADGAETTAGNDFASIVAAANAGFGGTSSGGAGTDSGSRGQQKNQPAVNPNYQEVLAKMPKSSGFAV